MGIISSLIGFIIILLLVVALLGGSGKGKKPGTSKNSAKEKSTKNDHKDLD